MMTHLAVKINGSKVENMLNIRRGQKRKRPFLSSEKENDIENRCIEVATDEIIWQETECVSVLGKA